MMTNIEVLWLVRSPRVPLFIPHIVSINHCKLLCE